MPSDTSNVGGSQSETGIARVVIAQCTGSKRDEPAPARDLYDESAYFRRQREYAVARGDVWFIQSAKHGLLAPETEIEPYDKHAQKTQEVSHASLHG